MKCSHCWVIISLLFLTFDNWRLMSRALQPKGKTSFFSLFYSTLSWQHTHTIKDLCCFPVTWWEGTLNWVWRQRSRREVRLPTWRRPWTLFAFTLTNIDLTFAFHKQMTFLITSVWTCWRCARHCTPTLSRKINMFPYYLPLDFSW